MKLTSGARGGALCPVVAIASAGRLLFGLRVEDHEMATVALMMQCLSSTSIHFQHGCLMAEIDIKKKDAAAWPWIILGLIVLAVAAWYFFLRPVPLNPPNEVNGDSASVATDRQMSPGASDNTSGSLPAAVVAFNQFVESQPSPSAGPSHEYTADGIEKLADAIDGLSQKRVANGVNVSEVLSELRARADTLRKDPSSTAHARKTREAFLLASGLMKQVQEANYPSLASATGQLNDAALAVKVDTPLLEQTAEVNQYFSQAASTLTMMSRAP